MLWNTWVHFYHTCPSLVLSSCTWSTKMTSKMHADSFLYYMVCIVWGKLRFWLIPELIWLSWTIYKIISWWCYLSSCEQTGFRETLAKKKKKSWSRSPCRRKIVLWLIFIVLKGWMMCVIKLKDWTNILKLGKFKNIVTSYTYFFFYILPMRKF